MAIGKITSKSLAADAVTSANLAPGAVTINDIPDSEITADKLHTTLDLSTKTLTLTQASVTAHQSALSVTQSQISDLSTTTDLTEGTNLYYTDARADARITASDTDALSEGSTNLYYTDARADARITASDTDALSEGSTNLYYTDARADARAALLVDSAPATLDTLNELAAALGDDPNFATTVINSIATKLPLAGGTMTGDLQINSDQLTLYNAANNNNTYITAQNTGGGNAGVKMKNAQGEWTIIANDRLRFIDDDASLERLSILSNGNVGIGTSSPSQKLHVNGSMIIQNGTNDPSLYIYGRNTDEHSAIRFASNTGTVTGSIMYYDTGMYFDASGANLNNSDLTILENGSVGIGTSTPATKLDVAGTVTADQYNTDAALPTVRPSVLLDFANTKTLDPRITFARASVGTYWDGKTTTKAEENLFIYSQEMASWPRGSGTTITSNTATAPDGTTTADRVLAAANWYGAYRVSLKAGQQYTLSCYVKSNTASNQNFVLFRENSIYVATETATTSWQRFTYTFTVNSSTASDYGLWNSGNGVGNDLLVWGMQLEQRNLATNYTATTSTPIVKYQPKLRTAGVDFPRFDHDPITGESKGLLIEESRTNLVTYSEDFTQSNWTKGAVTIKTDGAVAPDGSLANTIVETDATNTEHLAYNGNSNPLGSNATFAMSIYLKDGSISGRRYAGIRNNSGASGAMVVFDLQTGTVVDTNASGNYTITSYNIEDAGNGWYYCSAVFSDGGDGYREFRIQLVNSASPSYNSISSVAYTGDGISSIYAWGAQMELGHGASSYIPTSGSTVTRSADDVSIALTNEVSLQEATVYAEAATYRAYAAETAWCPVWQLNDGVSNANGVFDVRAFQQTYGSMAVANGFSGTTDLLNDSQTVTNGEFYKYGFFWNQGSVSFYKNGSLVNSATNQYANPVWDTLDIGWADRGGRRLDGHIKKLAVYSQVFSNDTLIAMTKE